MRRVEIQKVLLEAVIVAVAGATLALAANQLSPRGLALNRNYFPTGVVEPAHLQTNSPAAVESSEADPVGVRLRGKGLVDIGREDVQRGLGDSQIVLVDARDEEKFEEAHIPGAYELDPYHPERALGTVLPRCETARKVVVYCAGGECEDADSVALLLRDAGAPGDRLAVYGGGMNEWSAQHLPVEKGPHP